VSESKLADGRIALTIRIGVTGHRDLDDVAVLRSEVTTAFGKVIRTLPKETKHTRYRFVVVSALAGGADQLIADAILEYRDDPPQQPESPLIGPPDVSLEAVIPLEHEAYRRRFETEESINGWVRLSRRATRTTVIPPTASSTDLPDTERYRQCGRYIVRHSDVVFAIWNGEKPELPGGTADIVDFARRQTVPLVWIGTDGQHRVTQEIGGTPIEWSAMNLVDENTLQHLDGYNHPRLSATKRSREIDSFATAVEAAAKEVKDLEVPDVRQWLGPYVARAEILAKRFHRQYNLLGVTRVLLALFAVVVIARQELFRPGDYRSSWPEPVALALALVAFTYGRMFHPRDRWITARYLAESMRSAAFLVIAGFDDEPRLKRQTSDVDPPDAWIARAYSTVWAARPQQRTRLTSADVGPLQRFLALAWIDRQVGYHKDTALRHARFHLLAGYTTYVLFFASLTAAILHFLNVLHHHGGEPFALWGFLSIVVPAAGAAVSAIVAERQYHQHERRHSRMAAHLSDMAMQVGAATSIKELGQLAIAIADAMHAESGEWFGSVRTHDLELAA
jgi:hypothetical protein